MMTSFMLFSPRWSVLYILTNSILSIGQQKLVERQFGMAPASQAAATENKKDFAALASTTKRQVKLGSNRINLNGGRVVTKEINRRQWMEPCLSTKKER